LCYPEEYRASKWQLQEVAVSPVAREIGTAPSHERLPRWLFVSDNHRLRSSAPVQVLLYEDDGTYYVECPGLHVFARGDTQDAALDDLDQQVVYFFTRYSSMDSDAVTGLAERLRQVYVDKFTCEQV
jgi:hypothetical protein